MIRILMILLKNIAALPALTVKLYRYAARPERNSKEQKHALIRCLAERIHRTGNVEIQVYGRENLPKENGYIFYPNHQGMFDCVAITEACGAPFSPILKRELMSVPFAKQIFICMDAIPMDRDNPRQSLLALREAAERVRRKENCLIFPEGTRSRDGNRLLEFKGGSFKAAVRAKCPVVPVALVDSWKPFDRGGTSAVTVQVHILEPILYGEYQKLNTTELAAAVKRRIEDAITRNAENFA